MNTETEPLALIVGVSDHIEVLNLLESIDENIEVLIILNNPSARIKNLFKNLEFKNFTLKTVEISISRLGNIKNIGILNSVSPNVLFLDADCIPGKGVLRIILDFLVHGKIGKANIVIKKTNWFNEIMAKNRVSTKQNAAYTPGLFFRKSIISEIGGYYYRDDLAWREDWELEQRIEKNRIEIAYLKDAVIFHPEYHLYSDLRTAFRCGGGQYTGCSRGYITPSLRWGGGKNFISSVAYDIYRLPYLLTVQFYRDLKKFGLLASIYKIIWKAVFSFGYYDQMLHHFLDSST